MHSDAETLRQRFEPKQVQVLEADPQVFAARFAPCGRLLVAGGFDGRLYRWSVDTGDVTNLPPLKGHQGWPTALAFHPREPLMFSADSWGRICCWSTAEESRQPQWTIDQAHDGWIRDLAVSPDGSLFATCANDGTIQTWSSRDGRQRKRLADSGADTFCIRFHPDGKSLWVGDSRGSAKQWDLGTGQCQRECDAGILYKYHRIQEVGGIRCMSLNSQGTLLACGGAVPRNGGNVTGTPTLLLFDLASGELKRTLSLGTTNDVYVCDVHLHDGGFVVAVTSGTPGSGKLLYQRPEDDEPFFVTTKMANCHSLSLHPDGRRLAVTATNRGSNGNGRRLDKNGDYVGNTSPIHIFEMPAG